MKKLLGTCAKLTSICLAFLACDYAGGKGPLTQTDMSPEALGKFPAYKLISMSEKSSSSKPKSRSLPPISNKSSSENVASFEEGQVAALREKCGDNPELVALIHLKAELQPEDVFTFFQSLTPEETKSLFEVLQPEGDDTEMVAPPPFVLEQKVSLCVRAGSDEVLGWGIHGGTEYDFQEASYDGETLFFSFEPTLEPNDLPDYLRTAYTFLDEGVYPAGASVEIPDFHDGAIVEEDYAFYKVAWIESIGSPQAADFFHRIFEENENIFAGFVLGEVQVFTSNSDTQVAQEK